MLFQNSSDRVMGHLCQQKCLLKLLLMKRGCFIVYKSDTNMKCIYNSIQMSSELHFWVKMWWTRDITYSFERPLFTLMQFLHFPLKQMIQSWQRFYSCFTFFIHTDEKVAQICLLYYNYIKIIILTWIKSQFKCQHTKGLFKTPDRPIFIVYQFAKNPEQMVLLILIYSMHSAFLSVSLFLHYIQPHSCFSL